MKASSIWHSAASNALSFVVVSHLNKPSQLYSRSSTNCGDPLLIWLSEGSRNVNLELQMTQQLASTFFKNMVWMLELDFSLSVSEPLQAAQVTFGTANTVTSLQARTKFRAPKQLSVQATSHAVWSAQCTVLKRKTSFPPGNNKCWSRSSREVHKTTPVAASGLHIKLLANESIRPQDKTLTPETGKACGSVKARYSI